MNVAAFITDLRRQGVELVVKGDRLRWRAPEGTMTPELIGALRHNKEAVITALVQPPPATVIVVRQYVDQAANYPADGKVQHRLRPALSSVPLTSLYSVRPGDEWLADPWYGLGQKPDPDDFEERAAIMEYDGELSREVAQILARQGADSGPT
ncbi:MAG: hypothetical protein QGD90_09420 [Candidatus Hydrogenedentes bacterium]|nr:hypothetical protein [Candidatus Hydrogenedentota bacterium]